MSSKFCYLLKKSFIFRFSLLLLFFAGLAVLILYSASFTGKTPFIKSISPSLAKPEEPIKIEGKHFGNKFDSSWIKIGDSIIQSENCELWTDEKIVFKYPEYQTEGLLYVVVQNKKSNPSFLAPVASIPIIKDELGPSEAPAINALSSDFVEVGNIVKIYGENFGDSRGYSKIMFIPNLDQTVVKRLEQKEEVDAFLCSEYDFDFVLWSNTEIHVRVPDGADSGMLVVLTKNGPSQPIPFRVKNKIGSKIITNKKKFVIASEVDVSNIKAMEKNNLFLKVPLPIESYSQKDLKILSISPTPFVKNYQGSTIHQYENTNSSTKIHIRQEYSINTYEVNTKINPINIRVRSRNNREIYETYTNSTEFIPSNNPTIIKTAKEIVKNEVNPYNKAKRIYNYLLNNIEIIPASELNSGFSPIDALTEKKADTYDISILFACLLRAVGIPAQPLAGIVVDASQTGFLHWWNEFYIEGFGWVPADLGMAKAIPFDMGIPRKETWYFGNLDAFRVAFSRGQSIQTPMASNSKIASKERTYAMSSGWEEFSGIDSYSSNWRIPKVIAIY